jgi:hypothetical protein
MSEPMTPHEAAIRVFTDSVVAELGERSEGYVFIHREDVETLQQLVAALSQWEPAREMNSLIDAAFEADAESEALRSRRWDERALEHWIDQINDALFADDELEEDEARDCLTPVGRKRISEVLRRLPVPPSPKEER